MCKKSIICMGNSYKNGGRCLAGIEVKKSYNGYTIVRNNDGSPKWIRPVMADDTVGIPERIVGQFGILDILEVDVTGNVPTGAHSENVRFRTIERTGHYNGNLAQLCDGSHTLIFGNRGKAVPADVFENGGYSLMTIHPQNPELETQYDDYGHEKYYIHFVFRGNSYCFKLTDPQYIRYLQNGGTLSEDIYLTLSLGVNFHDWHFKLVAGVMAA